MQLIVSSEELKSTFIRLLDEYQEYYFATAWAGMPEDIINCLIDHSDRIVKMVVGIHFYQTDPSFIEEFTNNRNVRTLMQPNGTYHPKVFLFYTSDKEWSLLIGSANFTKAAFTVNTEATFLITSKTGNNEILSNAKKIVADGWGVAKKLNDEQIRAYRLQWMKMRRKKEEITGEQFTAILKATDFMSLTWQQFVKKFDGRRDIVKRRCEMLESIRQFFDAGRSLKDMSDGERKLILGNNNDLVVPGHDRWADFGTSGNGQFMNKIIAGNRFFSDALDYIPLTGEVTEEHFNSFVSKFKQDMDVTDGWVSSAARLLAMKRPDTFYNITNANRSKFCKNFANTQSHTRNLGNYWELVVRKIQLSNWYYNNEPKNAFERQLYDTRAAMLDVLYFEGFGV